MRVLARAAVSVPASTSNLGPGFDCLGLALDLRNELILELVEGGGPDLVEIEGEGAETLPRGRDNLMVKAARGLLPRRPGRRLVFRAKNRIPVARGLGSSAAAVVAGLWAASRLPGARRLGLDELAALAVRLEGHPDNVVPCARGGLAAGLAADGRTLAVSLPIHRSLKAVVCAPDAGLSTAKSRSVLPRSVPLRDAVFNVSRALLLARALERGEAERLPLLMDDRLHQPYRARLVPGLKDVLAAALGAGAAGAALSGSGPSVFAFVKGSAGPRVGEAMRRAFARRGVPSRRLELGVDRRGVLVRS